MKTVAIIGGGPAGAIAAEKLSRGGVPVTVFEERPGWEKPCGGGLPYKAVRRYPFLLEAQEEHKCVRHMELVAANRDSVQLRLREPLLIYSRATLNRLLLRRAQEAGAAMVRDRILSFHRESGGWSLEGRGGEYNARYLIMAGGARTHLRSLLTEPLAARDFMLTFGYYVPGSDHLLRIRFFDAFEGYAWSFPRPGHLDLGICGKVGESNMAGLRERLHGFMEEFGYPAAGAMVFSHLLPALSAETWHNVRLAGDGWALAGDAGGLVDPVTGEGIYFAMRSGELLAEALLDDAPETYPERVWHDFGSRLALGARLARYFYHEEFLGDTSSSRLVQFSAHSPAFMELLQDLIDGSQSYSGLAARLYRTLARSLLEIGTNSVRAALRSSEEPFAGEVIEPTETEQLMV